MKNTIIKIILSVAVVAIAITIYIFLKPNPQSTTDGSFEFIVVDASGTTIIDDTLSFNEGDKLWDVLLSHYDDMVYDTTEAYGVRLLGIGGIMTNFENGSYLALFVDDNYSNYGISSIPLVDGMKFKIVETIL